MLPNALAAAAVGLVLGLPAAEAAAALAEFQPIARRSQVVTLPIGVHLLNDCYNANPVHRHGLADLDGAQGSKPGRRGAGRHARSRPGGGPGTPEPRPPGRRGRGDYLVDLWRLPPGGGRGRTGRGAACLPPVSPSAAGGRGPGAPGIAGAGGLAPGERLRQHASGGAHRPFGGELIVGYLPTMLLPARYKRFKKSYTTI